LIANSLPEIASGRGGRRPEKPNIMLSGVVGAQRSGPPAPQAELGKNCGVSGNKPATNECFLGRFLPFPKRASQLSLFSKNRRRWPKDGKSGHGTLWNRPRSAGVRGRRNRCGFGQPSSCSSPRAVLEAGHGPSPQSPPRSFSEPRQRRRLRAARTHLRVPGQSSYRAAARGHGGRGAANRRRRNQRLGGCWRSTASTPVSGASWARPARCGWSRPALPLAAAVVGEAPAGWRSNCGGHRSQQ
jgi:hypothetical protein